MNPERSRLPPSSMIVVMFCATYLLAPLQAFSTWKFTPRRMIGWHSTSSCSAVFQDEDCEDLCGAFGEDSTTQSLSVDMAEEKESVTKEKSIIGRVPQKRITRPRRPRALWWTEEGADKCESCTGSGEQTCRFCGGTDFLSAIGGESDALFYEGIGKDCPVCTDGIEVCQECAGTGHVFKWRPPRNQTGLLHP